MSDIITNEQIYAAVMRISESVARIETREDERDKQCAIHSKEIEGHSRALYGGNGSTIGMCEKIRALESSNTRWASGISGGVSVFLFFVMSWIKSKFWGGS